MKPFPVGASRDAVYSFMQQHGFVMSNWSDKAWSRADGVEARIFGAGSMVQLSGPITAEGPLAETVSKLPLRVRTLGDSHE